VEAKILLMGLRKFFSLKQVEHRIFINFKIPINVFEQDFIFSMASNSPKPKAWTIQLAYKMSDLWLL